jgi:serine/threonine protein kinase
MERAHWNRIKESFSAVAELPPDQRTAALSETEPWLRAEVEKLLTASEQVGDFIEQPILARAAAAGALTFDPEIGSRIDDYVILEKIGEGGMGSVYKAEHQGEEFSQLVALKLIKRGMDTSAVLKRFYLERQILASLEHPNIAHLLDAGSTVDGLPYFVMELVRGKNIRDYCSVHELQTKERLRLFLKVCRAVSYAHQKLIVHRDLKPSNIIVTDSGEPKLLDFGIAKLLSPDWRVSENEHTLTPFRVMTPEYASPEQLRGQLTTTASDVYSLGVVLYELLTGSRPYKFESKDPGVCLEELLNSEPPRPSSVALKHRSKAPGQTDAFSAGRSTADQQSPATDSSDMAGRIEYKRIGPLDPDVDNIILKAIQKDATDRYSSVEEFAEDIDRYLNGLPVRATGSSRFYRWKKFVSRHRAATATAALIMSLFGFAVWQSIVATEQRAKAENNLQQVQEVVRFLLGETTQNLNKLPEGRELKQEIIAKAAAVLESVSPDIDNGDYLIELGKAYRQLGHARTWELRDYRQAEPNLQKAVQLHERAVKLRQNDTKYLSELEASLKALSEFYWIQRHTDKIIETQHRLINLNLRRSELEPNNLDILFTISKSFGIVSEVEESEGLKEQSATNLAAALETLNNTIALQQQQEKTTEASVRSSVYLMQKAKLLSISGDHDSALSTLDQAVETADEAYQTDRTQMFAFNNAVRSRRMMADIHIQRGNWQEAHRLYEQCLDKLLQNQDNRSLEQTYQQPAVAIYTMRLGLAKDKLGRKREGAELMDQGLELYAQNRQINGHLASTALYSLELLQPALTYYSETQQRQEAAELVQNHSIKPLEAILEKTPDDAGILFAISDAYAEKGDLLTGFSEKNNRVSADGRTDLSEALESYTTALRYAEKAAACFDTPSGGRQKREAIAQKIQLLSSKLQG